MIRCYLFGPSGARASSRTRGEPQRSQGSWVLTQWGGWLDSGLTLVGTVGMRLVAVIPAVIVPVTGPVLRDAAPAVALELGAGAGVAAAGLVTVVPTVVVWGGGGEEGESGRLG